MSCNQGRDNKKASKLRPLKNKSKSIKTDDNGEDFQSLGGDPRVSPPPQQNPPSQIPPKTKKPISLVDQRDFPRLSGYQLKQLETSNHGESEKKEKVRENPETSSPKKEETRSPIEQKNRQAPKLGGGRIQLQKPKADSNNGQEIQNNPMKNEQYYEGDQINNAVADSGTLKRTMSTKSNNHVATRSSHYTMAEPVRPKPQLGKYISGTDKSAHTITRNHLQTIIQALQRDQEQKVEKPIKVEQIKLPTNMPKVLQGFNSEDGQRSWNRKPRSVLTQSRYEPKKNVSYSIKVPKEDDSELGSYFKMNTLEILHKNLDKIKGQTKVWNNDNWQELIKKMEAEMKQLQQCWNIIKNRSSRQYQDDQRDQEQKIQKICQNFGDQSLQLISSTILDLFPKGKDPDVVQEKDTFNYHFNFRNILNIVDGLRLKKQWSIQKQKLKEDQNYKPKFVWRYFQSPYYIDRQLNEVYGQKVLGKMQEELYAFKKQLGIKKKITVYHVHGKRKNYDGKPRWKAFLEEFYQYKVREDATGKQEGYFEVEYS